MNKFTKAMRVARLESAPVDDDLEQLAFEAGKNPNQSFEIVWPAKSDGSQLFFLTCSVKERREILARKAPSDMSTAETMFRGFKKTFGADKGIDQNLVDPNSKSTRTEWTLRVDSEFGPKLLWTDSSDEVARVLERIGHDIARHDRQEQSEAPPPAPTQTIPQIIEEVETATLKKPQPLLTVPETISTTEHAAHITLAGDIEKVELNSILQSLGLLKMTGRLNLYNQGMQAEVYFSNGSLMHADMHSAFDGSRTIDLTPTQIVLDLLTWQQGNFRFHTGWTTDKKTIERRLEGLLLEGASLTDYQKGLAEKGFAPDSTIRRTNLDEDEFERLNREGIPVDFDLQLSLYRKVGRATKASEIIAGLPAIKWLPIIFNLINGGMIAVESSSHEDRLLEPVTIDEDLAYNASRSLARPDTGVVTLPFFLNFLKLEFARAKRRTLPLSIVFLDFDGDGVTREDLSRVTESFYLVQEDFDLFAHYETLDQNRFAILLPYKNAAAAYLFLERFVREIRLKFVGDSPFTMRMGCASYPEDAQSLEKLLSATIYAKKQAYYEKTEWCTFSGVERDEYELLKRRGEAARETDRIADAYELWNEALELAKNFDRADPRLSLALRKMGELSILQANYEVARLFFQLCSGIKTPELPQTDWIFAVHQLARCCFELKKYDEAVDALERSLEDVKLVCGDGQTMAETLTNLGTAYQLAGKCDAAKDAFSKSIGIMRNLYGIDSNKLSQVKQQFTRTLMQTGELSGQNSEEANIVFWIPIHIVEKRRSNS